MTAQLSVQHTQLGSTTTELTEQAAAPIDHDAALTDHAIAPKDQSNAPIDPASTPNDHVTTPTDHTVAPMDHADTPNTARTPNNHVTTLPDHAVAPYDEANGPNDPGGGAAVASGVISCRANDRSSPSKRLSPADVSVTNEEWETASEGSDGGVQQQPRRQTTQRRDMTGQATHIETTQRDDITGHAIHRPDMPTMYSDGTSRSTLPVKGPPSTDAVRTTSHGRSVNLSHHSPCASGVPSSHSAGTDCERYTSSPYHHEYHYNHRDDGMGRQHSVSVRAASTNTNSADVVINHSSSSAASVIPSSSRLFAVQQREPPLVVDDDALVRFVYTLTHSRCVFTA